MPSLAPAPLAITLFLPDLEDRPDRRSTVDLAHGLLRAGVAVDVVVPMGGGPLRAALNPAVGQIDLAKRHAATSALALARVIAERQPSLLALPRDVSWVGRLALWLGRSDARLVVLEGDAETDFAAIRAAAPRWG
ncbi:hypothetical protein HUE56_17630 [Azospirillum oryzae]|uniref:Glycosyl transferase n=1 Tax=Azospirillum oryzae TaxID=286727 RepID=A0A6N1AKL3_9PROT|nr:hypothetical protein [Azospirillum oryzae]KAA0590939.1 hypothetical protein FZ938_02220 [Azospirillum oryzae]QKS52226.1 hypothetical protein HUE56_17630 [Azospirillum oryzae]GLR78644.1 hypothetical protein GCM10007856_13170 [Azospirillum oryzae]